MLDPIDREEVLIARLVGREEAVEDWCELRERAAADTTLWARVVDALEDDACLRRGGMLVDGHVLACEALDALADRVELPVASSHGSSQQRENEAVPFGRRVSWRSFDGLGWVAALVIAWFWLAGGPRESQSPSDGSAAVVSNGDRQSTDESKEENAEELIGGFSLRPAVLAELPKVLVRSSPTDSGDRFEVVYLRRTLERAVVQTMYEMRGDEAGKSWPVPMKPAAYAQAESF